MEKGNQSIIFDRKTKNGIMFIREKMNKNINERRRRCKFQSRFTIATHMMIIIAMQDTDSKVTSDFLAASVGVNPVIIRKTLSQLKKQD